MLRCQRTLNPNQWKMNVSAISPSSSTQSRLYLLLLGAGPGRRQQLNKAAPAAPLLTAGAMTHGSLLGPTAFEPGSFRLTMGGMPWGTALVGRRYTADVIYTLTAESTKGHRSAAAPRSWGEPDLLCCVHYMLVWLRRSSWGPEWRPSPTDCYVRASPNSGRARQGTASAGRRSCRKILSTRD